MLNWLRQLASPSDRPDPRSTNAGHTAAPRLAQRDYKPLRIDHLFVEPDETEDFDREACERLIAKIAESGATTVDDVYSIAVSLEDFFEGNRCKHSIAANVVPEPPYDAAGAWYELLKRIRDTDGVANVLVAISMIEPYEGGRVGMWPYSDTIWIYSSLDRDTIASLVAPIDPDEVRDASVNDLNWDLTPPLAPIDGVRPYWVWWD